MAVNDCLHYSCATMREGGYTTVRPCGCHEGRMQAGIKHGVSIPANSFLVNVAGVLEPWTSADQSPVAFTDKAIDTSAETAVSAANVWYLPAKVQGSVMIPTALTKSQAGTILRAAGAIVTSKT